MTLLLEANWWFILWVLLLSGGVAYLGDVIGRKIGRKRVTLFGLRPRHTSSLITILTAMGIALGTLIALAMISSTVHTALFRMKFIQRQVTELSRELQESREEHGVMETRLFQAQSDLMELEKQREKLQEDIRIMEQGVEQLREGRIVVMAKEILAQLGLERGALSPDIPPALEALRQKGLFAISQRMAGKDALPEPELTFARGTSERVCEILDAMEAGRKVLRLVAEGNAIRGEPVLCGVEIIQSRRIYEPSQELARETFFPGLDRTEAEQALYALLLQVNRKAVSEGVLRDPIRGTVGNLEGTEFFEAVEWIEEAAVPITVVIRAKENVYTEGPVKIRLEYLLSEE